MDELVSILAVSAYFGVVYIPIAICVAAAWFFGATAFRKICGGGLWKPALKRSAKEATLIVVFVSAVLLLLGLYIVMLGY